MKIWNYHPETGELGGESVADRNPLFDPKNEYGDTEWIIPASATNVKPPKAKKGYAVCFNGGKWVQVEDHRGEVWHDDTGVSHTVMSLGVIPTELKPGEASYQPVVSDIRREAERRIGFVFPLFAQINALRTKNGADDPRFAMIDAIRAASNELGAMDPIPVDYQDDKHWS